MSSLTTQALAASLEKLLTKKTLDKITVKDITDDCGVNRQTFYYHFHDVYELVEWIFEKKAEEFITAYQDSSQWKENILRLMELLKENKSLILHTYRSVNKRQAESFLQNLAKPAVTDVVKEVSGDKNIDREDFDFIIDLFTFAFIGLLIRWVDSGMEKEYIQDLERFFILIEASLESTIDRFSK